MSYAIISTGKLPNDGLGDPLRVAFDKINNNFTSLNSLAGGNLATVSVADPLRTAFSKINDNFSTIFTSVATSLVTLESGNVTPSTSSNVVNVDQMVVTYPSLNQEIINVGVLPNDGVGDSLRTAFTKINNNFSRIFGLVGDTSQPVTVYAELVPDPVPVVDPNQTQNILNIGQFIINSTQIINSTPLLGATLFSSPVPYSLVSPAMPYGAQEWINIGEQPNDGEGDPLRTAFAKINNNFSNLFFTATTTGNTFTTGLDPEQVIYETPASTFSQGKFQIRSSDPSTIDMQDITITASIKNDLSGVKFSGYGTLFDGNALCRYDMDVFAGNVRLLINPIKDTTILHFIASAVTFIGDYSSGLNIGLDGYPDGSVMGTEDDIILTTEYA